MVMEHNTGNLSEQVGDVQTPKQLYRSDQRTNESLLIRPR
jgi:hypothetical protein